MLSYKILILIFIIQFVDYCVPFGREIPSYIKVCNQSDPKLGVCIRKSINSLKPHLIQGIPELDVPPIDPLFVPKIAIAQNGGIQVAASFHNISIYGAGDFRLRSVRTEIESNKMKIKIWYPQLSLNATYDIRGQLLMLPIAGQGKCWGNFTDIDGSVSVQLERVQKNGQEHFKTQFMKIEFNIGGATSHLYNLFNGESEVGNLELGNSVNQFINENWKIVAAEIRPNLEATIAKLLTEIADRFFEAFPINKLLDS